VRRVVVIGVAAATASGPWIADGNYSHRIRQITWPAADTIVWLDLPRRTMSTPKR
jgi:hypothetical protein